MGIADKTHSRGESRAGFMAARDSVKHIILLITRIIYKRARGNYEGSKNIMHLMSINCPKGLFQ